MYAHAEIAIYVHKPLRIRDCAYAIGNSPLQRVYINIYARYKCNLPIAAKFVDKQTFAALGRIQSRCAVRRSDRGPEGNYYFSPR